jgi:hypothetical protein
MAINQSIGVYINSSTNSLSSLSTNPISTPTNQPSGWNYWYYTQSGNSVDSISAILDPGVQYYLFFCDSGGSGGRSEGGPAGGSNTYPYSGGGGGGASLLLSIPKGTPSLSATLNNIANISGSTVSFNDFSFNLSKAGFGATSTIYAQSSSAPSRYFPGGVGGSGGAGGNLDVTTSSNISSIGAVIGGGGGNGGIGGTENGSLYPNSLYPYPATDDYGIPCSANGSPGNSWNNASTAYPNDTNSDGTFNPIPSGYITTPTTSSKISITFADGTSAAINSGGLQQNSGNIGIFMLYYNSLSN